MTTYCRHGVPEFICHICNPSELYVDDDLQPVFTCTKCGTRTARIEDHLSENHMGPADRRWGWIAVAMFFVMVGIVVAWRILR